MAQILWRPIADELDRAMFVFECPDDWTAIDGWTGKDIASPDLTYLLETVSKAGQKRGIVRKFEKVQGTLGTMRPLEVDRETIEEAAGHIGIDRFRTEPVSNTLSCAVWILPEAVEF